VSIHEPRPVATHGPETPAEGSPLRERVLSLRLPQQQANAQSSGGGRAAWVLVVVLIAVVAVLVYLLMQKRSAETLDTAGPLKPAADASMASSGDIALDSKGYIMPVQRILVSPKVSGMIIKLGSPGGPPILEGLRVRKGDILAELEDTNYKLDLAHAESAMQSAKEHLAELKDMWPKEIGQAKAELERAKAELAQLKADYERDKQLFHKQKAISQLDFELAESKCISAEHHVESLDFALRMMESSRVKKIAAAEADVQQAIADRDNAQWRLDNTKIRAPISGTILKKNAEEGNLVNPIAMNGSFSLCDLADLSDIEVELNIQERDVSKVSVGQKCKVRTEAYPDRVYDGVVSRLMPVADRSKAAIPVRVKVNVPQAEEGVYLKPDMIANVSFLRGTGK
jgi:multidrug resistance efflux pump